MKVEQKFKKGDLVRVVKGTRHLGKKAVIEGSYKDLYGGLALTYEYSIHFERYGKEAWYGDDYLELIENDRWDLVKKWEDAAAVVYKNKGNLDWVFANGEDVLENPHHASIESLARCFTDKSLWGTRGEAFTYVNNARRTLSMAESYLIEGDKEGWLKFCKEIKEAR